MNLPGAKSVLQHELLERIDRSGKKGITTETLVDGLDETIPQEILQQSLGALRAEGNILKRAGHWVAVRQAGLRSGTLQVLERGDALIRSGARGEPGWFVRRRDRKGALDGDLVLFKRAPKSKRRDRSFRLPEAIIVERVEIRSQTVVGTLEVDDNRRWLVPFDPKIKIEIEVEGGDDLLENQYIVAELAPRRTVTRGPARATVQEVLGSIETPGVDVEVVLHHYQIPDQFPDAVLAEAADLPEDPIASDFEGREDLRGKTIVTIDGETSRDFDDAVSVEALPNDRYLLGVHIADVSAYVHDGSALDLEAYKRGTSVYYPDRAVPMLPEHLSNGLCSLRPDVPRLTLTAWMTVEPDGTVSERRFAETVVQSKRRFTYQEVAARLESKTTQSGDDGATAGLLHDLQQLMRRLLRRRLDRGSIDFDLPEGDVILDTDGFTVGVQPGERNQRTGSSRNA